MRVCTFDGVIESVEISSYGRAATERLARAVEFGKSRGPLAPVTVVVPSNFVGLSARRLLGSGGLGSGSATGIANVSFVTPFRLAELVVSDLVLDKPPITNPVLGAAVRAVLADDPGIYRAVRHHEATEAALASLFGELSNVDEAGLEAIEAEGSPAAVRALDFYRRIASQLTDYQTEYDLVTAAADRVDLAERLDGFGHVVWYLPAPTTAAIERFLGDVLREAPSSSVIVGSTGNELADQPVLRACEAAGVAVTAAEVAVAAAEPVASGIISVTDADEEVRAVCREVIDLLERGVRADRIGIFYPTPNPYVRIIQQQFGRAEVPVNGPDPRRLAESVAGRTLLGALDLPGARWRRHSVMALVSGAPLRFDDRPVRPTVWDDLSRRAGVVGGLDDWRTKLKGAIDQCQRNLERAPADVEPAEHAERIVRSRDRLADYEQLLGFLDWAAAAIAQVNEAGTWADKAAAAKALLNELLGAEHQHAGWPEADHAAFGRVEQAIERLSSLDAIEPHPSQDVFVRALRAELDVARGRYGRFGLGVTYGPLGSAVGHDLDAVFVVGGAEGLLPIARRDDAILPEAVRSASLHQLESRSARLHHQHRAFLAALAAAPDSCRVVTFPRGDLRSSRVALPSRWLLDSASALVGQTVHATEFDRIESPSVQHVDSFVSGLSLQPAASLDEYDLATVGRVVDSGRDPLDVIADQAVGRGVRVQRARSSAEFTEYDGNLAAQVGAPDGPLPELGDQQLSPSRLETWASCGFRYFLQYVLQVDDRDDPERIEELSPLERGSLVHTVLERFVREAIESEPPPPDQPWSEAQRQRLFAIADEVCDDYEYRGRTGRRAAWQVQRSRLQDVLEQFLHADNEFRRENDATPTHVEVDLGDGDGVTITTDSGRAVRLRGKVDRIDSTTDGRVLVNDYKTGKGDKYNKLDRDPFLNGTSMQLAVYSEGALGLTGATTAEAYYWLVENRKKTRVGITWNPERREQFHSIVSAVAHGIESGVFDAQPGDWNIFWQAHSNCRYCPYDAVCPRDRGEQATAKADAPEMAIRHTLDTYNEPVEVANESGESL